MAPAWENEAEPLGKRRLERILQRLADLLAQYLAQHGLGQFVDRHDAPRDLVRSQPLAAKGPQGLLIEFRVRLYNDGGNHLLTAGTAGQAHDCDV